MKTFTCSTILATTLLVSANAQIDLGVQNFFISPTTIDTFVDPDHILFDLLNYGPGANCDVDVELILSSNAVAGDSDDHVLGPVTHTQCLDPYRGVHDELSTPEKAQLAIPAELTGKFHVFLRISPSGQVDTDTSDNVVGFTNMITVPQLGSTGFAVMANETMVTSNMNVAPQGQFEYNWVYGDNWRILGPGSGFTATFNTPAAGAYLLRVRHGTSADASCPNGGYAPVTITINGTNIVSEYDVAEHHHTFGYANDTWLMQVVSGENTLTWIADDLCTHYWIQRVDIKPAMPPHIDSITRTPDSEIQLLISSSAGTTNAIETSTNLVDWSVETNIWNVTGTMTWQEAAPPSTENRFYRILQLGF